MAARNKVLNTTELLEAILGQAPGPDILTAAHVCLSWAQLMHTSPQIARQLLQGSFAHDYNHHPDPTRLYYFSVTTARANERLLVHWNRALKLENYIILDTSAKSVRFLTTDATTVMKDGTRNLIFKSAKAGRIVCRTTAVETFGPACSRAVWWSDRWLKDCISRRLLKR